MAQIYNKANVSKEDIKKIRDFIKDYNTERLSILLTNDWRILKTDNKRRKILLSSSGVYYWGNGFLSWIGGKKNLRLPAIIIRYNGDWWNTFLHEFGHYIQYLTEGFRNKNKRNKEKYARNFCELKS